MHIHLSLSLHTHIYKGKYGGPKEGGLNIGQREALNI